VSLKIPPRVGTHRLLIAVYRPIGKDVSRTFARCELSFEIIAGERNGPTPMSVESAPQSHLYFSQHYIEQAVTAALQRNMLVADETCVEGRVATRSDRTPLDGHFTLQANSVGSRALAVPAVTGRSCDSRRRLKAIEAAAAVERRPWQLLN
jgi:hypothetical protein